MPKTYSRNLESIVSCSVIRTFSKAFDRALETPDTECALLKVNFKKNTWLSIQSTYKRTHKAEHWSEH